MLAQQTDVGQLFQAVLYVVFNQFLDSLHILMS